MGYNKYELHFHTKETSNCGQVSAKNAVRLYHDWGYKGIVVTDHYYHEWFRSLGSISWERKIDFFLAGYYSAKEEGKKLDILVLPGIEISFSHSRNDYLVFGFDEEFLFNNHFLYDLELNELKIISHESGAMVFQAHPYRTGNEPASAEYLDGMEVYNGNSDHNNQNGMAQKFCNAHHLFPISGSDFHAYNHAARGGIKTSKKIQNAAELTRVIQEREYSLIKME